MGGKKQRRLERRNGANQTSLPKKENNTPSNNNHTELGCPVPKGLPNLGNTCFFNSVLQCLLHTPPISLYFDAVGNEESLNVAKNCVVYVDERYVDLKAGTIPLDEPSMSFVHTFKNFLTEFRCGRSPNPRSVFDQVAKRVPRFRSLAQQDAHELLRYLLDGLRQEEIDRFKTAIEKYLDTENNEDDGLEARLLAKAHMLAVGIPALDRVFGGTLIQSIRCSSCDHVSICFEPFLDVSLPISRPTASFAPRNQNKRKSKKKNKKKGKGRSRQVSVEDSVELHNSDAASDAAAAEEEQKDSDAEADVEDEQDEVDDGPICETLNDLSVADDSEKNVDFTRVLANNGNGCDDGIMHSLSRFTAVETLSEANAYECESCCAPANKLKTSKRKTVTASKRYLLYRPPPILTLHLKRFEQLHSGNRTTVKKISGHIKFPLILDIAPFCVECAENVSTGQTKILYSLYGVVCHSGGLSGGHYIAYVRSRELGDHVAVFFRKAASFDPSQFSELIKNRRLSRYSQIENEEKCTEGEPKVIEEKSRWFRCSDSSITAVPESQVLSAEAYILFYERFY